MAENNPLFLRGILLHARRPTGKEGERGEMGEGGEMEGKKRLMKQ